ncbi:MAG: exodeoxyribonuclease III [Desulfocapsaceae bacterium]|nr:exodeoxyribonuclease III [Desulfocapsaceae bacterium]
MAIDIDYFLKIVASITADEKVPVVDLIAVQSRDPFKVLVATILSARTKDETTAVAAARLFKKAPTVDALAKLSLNTLEKLIYPVGFYKNKAGFLHALPEALKRFENRVPDSMNDLLSLPGVGRKTANLVLCTAFQKQAICVDTHVHRIMNIWQYVDTTTPEQTEHALRAKLPKNHWLSVNSLLVAFGQSICRPVGPRCDICALEPQCPQYGVTPRKLPMQKVTNQDRQRFISWNVNGLRALEKKGFVDIVGDLNADILAIQETKAQPDQLSDALKNIDGYTSYFNWAQKKGYSGVAVYTKKEPLQVTKGFGHEEFDNEGRVLTLEFPTYYFINIYFPNSGAELKRLTYKLEFNEALHAYLRQLNTNKTLIICGDYNVAHKEIDLKNPKTNVKNAGFTPEERAWMDHFIDSGFLDTFRMFNTEGGNYTWWSYRFNARAKNVGWRIDYFCVDQASQERVLDADILSEIMGSDHCPVSLDFRS